MLQELLQLRPALISVQGLQMLQDTCSSLAMGTIASLNLSVMEMKMLPLAGSFCPAAVAALAYALAKLVSMPITSPVDLISGPSSVSAPAQNGERATCTAQVWKLT